MKINKNNIWTEAFVNQLVELGVKYACISPGSRNTPLTLAFNKNKKIKTFVVIDERSSGFFATGLARTSDTPVVLVTTSGTAVAELYPAIIEAYQQRIPLLVCTADRPARLRNTGANQTINQHNIYKNHIRWFWDAGLPKLSKSDFARLAKKTRHAFDVAASLNRGPVHINFPFEKPLEPDAFTDEMDESIINNLINISAGKSKVKLKEISLVLIKRLAAKLERKRRGIIVCGPGNYPKGFGKLCNEFSNSTGYPVFVDALSGLKLGRHSKKNFVYHFNSFLRSEKIFNGLNPEIIIQFGALPTAKSLIEFLKVTKAEKIIVNQFGDLKDPARTARQIIDSSPDKFIAQFTPHLSTIKKNSEWIKLIEEIDKISGEAKNEFLSGAPFPFEGKIFSELLEALPAKCNLMISNSMPARDFDDYTQDSKIPYSVYSNRGVSGIDGINSTAFGIASESKDPTLLVTGDLAFLHDLNGLHFSSIQSIPLTILLINNNGGGIFEMLPIANQKEYFKENFITPHNINIEAAVKAFGGNFIAVNSWQSLKQKIKSGLSNKSLSVIEIKTDSHKSSRLRKEMFVQVVKTLEDSAE